MPRYALLVYILGAGSETSTVNVFRFAAKGPAEQAMRFLEQFSNAHTVLIEDI